MDHRACHNMIPPSWAVAFLIVTGVFIFDSCYWHFVPLPWHTFSSSSSSSAGSTPSPPPPLYINRSASVSSQNGGNIVPSKASQLVLKTMPSKAPRASLRALEEGLRSARIAMRTASTETNATRALEPQSLPKANSSSDYFPRGAIYRDAVLFRQSYHEMEKRFKVFVYAEGKKPLVHTGPCKEIYAIEGRFIQEIQAATRNRFVTKNPHKAHVFFLPFSVTMMVSYLYRAPSKDRSSILRFVRDYVDVIASKYPFWNKSEGANHFMLSCHDWGPFASGAHPHLHEHAIRVLCNANSSEGFVPDKDVSLPEINLVGGEVPTEPGGPAIAERPHLAFFAGRDHGPVRPVLYKYWEGRDNNVLVFRELPKGSPAGSYHAMMKSSKFCLCPGGYEVNSPRVVEAIYNDCIPVIIADKFVLPFSDVLDWDAFSLKVLERDIPNLKLILSAVPDTLRDVMQERVRQVRRHFLLNEPPQPYDAFHMILHSVWLRRLNIKLNYHR